MRQRNSTRLQKQATFFLETTCSMNILGQRDLMNTMLRQPTPLKPPTYEKDLTNKNPYLWVFSAAITTAKLGPSKRAGERLWPNGPQTPPKNVGTSDSKVPTDPHTSSRVCGDL